MSFFYAAKSPSGRVDEYTIREDYFSAIVEATGMNGSSYSPGDVQKAWEELRKQGWKIIRIQLVEVWSKK